MYGVLKAHAAKLALETMDRAPAATGSGYGARKVDLARTVLARRRDSTACGDKPPSKALFSGAWRGSKGAYPRDEPSSRSGPPRRPDASGEQSRGLRRCRARDLPDHQEEEGVDVRFVDRRLLEQEEGQRA